LPDFRDAIYQNGGKINQITPKLRKGHRRYQMAVIYLKWTYNIPTFAIPRHSKIYPNRDFWFENIPSGDPGSRV
jgi:IMP cyclohydrolase